MPTVSSSNFSDFIKPGLLAFGREKLGMKPGTVVQVSENPMFLGYDVTYKYQNYSKSIKISKEILEDKMATTNYAGDHLTDSLAYQAQQMGLQQSAHTHGGLGQVFGGSAGWATTTATGSTDANLTVNGTNYAGDIDHLWDEPEPMSKPKKKEPRWFRINEEFPKDFGLDHREEPLDDLRQEIAAWLDV